MKENGFMLTKVRSRRYLAWMITDVNYVDDIMLLVNTPTQALSLLHSLEWAAGGIGLHVNADKTKFMCFYQKVNISTLNGRSLKFVGKFTYLKSRISSTENDIYTQLAKAWTAIDRLLVIMLYTHNDINNSSKYKYKYRRTLSFQIQMGLLISGFSPWWHKERDTILKNLC